MDHLMVGIFLLSTVLLSVTSAGHALLHKRDARAALGWMSFCLTLPLLGPFIYWCLGINRISSRARHWNRIGRRISGLEMYPIHEERLASASLPVEASHLADISVLADRVVRTRLREGNLISPLFNGEETYPAMLDAICRAKTSINLSSYIFDADGIGADFIKYLREAADRGVEVRVIIDALGEKYSRISPRQALKHSQVMLRRYLPLHHGAYLNLRNHRKILIIDGREAYTGGMNIRSRHISSRGEIADTIHDIHFCVKGPVVNDLQRVFLEDWHFVTGERLDLPYLFPKLEHEGSALARSISDGPDKEYRKLEQIIMAALACADQSVWIMNPYFVPDRSMIAALITTALRGVDVRVILPAKNNLPFVHWATRALLAELVANGVRVFYQPPPFVHSKLLQVDQIWTLIGSANLDARSLRLNFELNMSVFDRSFASRIREHLEAALATAHEVSLSQLSQRSLPVKLRDNFARLLSPYL